MDMKMEQIHILSFPYFVHSFALHFPSVSYLSSEMPDGKWRRIYVLKAESIQRGQLFCRGGKKPCHAASVVLSVIITIPCASRVCY